MQGWNGPSPASEAVLCLPNTQGQVDDLLRDKVPEAPNYLLLGWEGGYKAFWVLLLPNLESPCPSSVLLLSPSNPTNAVQFYFVSSIYSLSRPCFQMFVVSQGVGLYFLGPCLRKGLAVSGPWGFLSESCTPGDLLFQVGRRSKELDWQYHWPETPAKFTTLFTAHIVWPSANSR